MSRARPSECRPETRGRSARATRSATPLHRQSLRAGLARPHQAKRNRIPEQNGQVLESPRAPKRAASPLGRAKKPTATHLWSGRRLRARADEDGSVALGNRQQEWTTARRVSSTFDQRSTDELSSSRANAGLARPGHSSTMQDILQRAIHVNSSPTRRRAAARRRRLRELMQRFHSSPHMPNPEGGWCLHSARRLATTAGLHGRPRYSGAARLFPRMSVSR